MNPLAFTLPFDFHQPAWLWLCLLAPLLIVASWRSLAGLDPVRKAAALLIRSVLVILIALCLAGVERVQRNDDLTVMFVMDRSHSVQALQQYQEEFVLAAAKKVPPKDRIGLVDFARYAFLQQLPMLGGYFIPPGRLPVMPNIDRTDVASGLRLAMAMFPHDTAKRIVLLSDGNDNMGDLLTEARRAKADGVPIDVAPLRYEHRNEVYFDRMIAPNHAEKGEQVPLRMVLSSQRRTSGTLSVFQNGKLVDIPPESAHIDLKPGTNTFFIKLPAGLEGAQTFEATFRPDDEGADAIAVNNTASAFTFVAGGSRVLLISSNPDHDAPLAEALRGENVEVELRDPSSIEQFDLLQMSGYSSIILANVPAAAFTDLQQKELATYVKEGSGLLMFGGDDSFGAGGWIGSPVEEVMPVSFEIKHKRVIPRGALVLIMHSCEVARGNFWATEMAKKSVDTISSQDYIGVLAYTYSPGGNNWEVPLDVAANKAAVKARIERMQIGDMPDFGSTMQMAYDQLTRGKGSDAAQKHCIIFSDGDAAAPSPQLLQKYKDAKITVSTVGIGWGVHVYEPTLSNIANQTGGKFYAPKNPKQLPQIFAKESKVVRRPLIVDQPFQPEIVQRNSDLLVGVDGGSRSLPPLGGMILTSPKSDPNVLILIVRSTDDGEDPVLAHWQHELGKSVAFTSGYWPVWGEQWTAWPKFAKFMAQIVRWTMRQEAPANFESYTKIVGNRGRIVVDALDKDASYLNFLQMRTNVIGPGNTPIPVAFTQTGPGKYEAEFPVEQSGQYLANVHIFDRGKMLGTLRTGLSAPFSPEYRDLTPNEALLRQVAEITGGRWLDVDPEQADVFSHDLPPTEAKRPAWEWVLAWLLLPAFLLDVAARRLANWLAFSIAVELVVLVVLLFGLELAYGPWWSVAGAFILAELIGWSIRFRSIGPLFEFLTHGVTALAQTGDRSAVALDKLRGTHERVKGTLSQSTREEVGNVRPDVNALPRSTSQRRFDAGDAGGKAPAGDLGEALGGAKTSAEPSKPTKPGQGKQELPEREDVTERLLRAKRRAQREKKDGE